MVVPPVPKVEPPVVVLPPVEVDELDAKLYKEGDFGIKTGWKIGDLLANGWAKIHDSSADADILTNPDIQEIRDYCDEDTEIIVSTYKKGDENLGLLGYDLCFNALKFAITDSATEAVKSKKNNDTFWYWNKQRAIGFSSKAQVQVSPLYDTCDDKCKGNQEKRLSLAIDKKGWRSGKKNIDSDSGYRRIILWRLNMEPGRKLISGYGIGRFVKKTDVVKAGFKLVSKNTLFTPFTLGQLLNIRKNNCTENTDIIVAGSKRGRGRLFLYAIDNCYDALQTTYKVN